MATLSNERKINIVTSESRLKFSTKLNKLEKDFTDEVEKLAFKTRPKWYTDEVRDSGMVKTSGCVDFTGMDNDPDFYEYHKTTTFSCHNQHPVRGYGNIQAVATKSLISKRAKVLKLKNERDEFESKLKKVLHAVNTDKKLMDHLPELGKKYAETTSGKMATALVPVEEIKEIKKLLVKEK